MSEKKFRQAMPILSAHAEIPIVSGAWHQLRATDKERVATFNLKLSSMGNALLKMIDHLATQSSSHRPTIAEELGLDVGSIQIESVTQCDQNYASILDMIGKTGLPELVSIEPI